MYSYIVSPSFVHLVFSSFCHSCPFFDLLSATLSLFLSLSLYKKINIHRSLSLCLLLKEVYKLAGLCFRFLLKADDDMWINVPSLLNTVKREESLLHTAVGGACRRSAEPIRNPRSKWYASHKAYPQKTYPGFCSGTSYVTSLNVVRHVTSVSPDVPFFYLEDVYVSLCIQKLGPPFRLLALRGFFHGGASPCILRSRTTISVHQVKPRRLSDIWNAKCP